MDVSGMGSTQGSGPVRSTHPATSSSPINAASTNPAGSASQGITSSKDELEISAAGRMLGQLNETPEARAERIAQIKEAIDNGDYDSDEKLEAALLRMFEVNGFDFGDE